MFLFLLTNWKLLVLAVAVVIILIIGLIVFLRKAFKSPFSPYSAHALLGGCTCPNSCDSSSGEQCQSCARSPTALEKGIGLGLDSMITTPPQDVYEMTSVKRGKEPLQLQPNHVKNLWKTSVEKKTILDSSDVDNFIANSAIVRAPSNKVMQDSRQMIASRNVELSNVV